MGDAFPTFDGVEVGWYPAHGHVKLKQLVAIQPDMAVRQVNFGFQERKRQEAYPLRDPIVQAAFVIDNLFDDP